MKLFIASDHAGFDLKQELVTILGEKNYTIVDLGPDTNESVDYPDYAKKLCLELQKDPDARGILLCGSGIGMSITANRYKGIRAALCMSEELARLSRQHNDANVLVLGSRFIDTTQATNILRAWLNTNFEAGRHERRVIKIDQ